MTNLLKQSLLIPKMGLIWRLLKLKTSSIKKSCFYLLLITLFLSLLSHVLGVSSLITLMNRKSDSEAPRLKVLLCESLVAVHMSLLCHALAMYDANVLYRLVGHPLVDKMWPTLYGGGIKKLIKVAPPPTETARKSLIVLLLGFEVFRKSKNDRYHTKFFVNFLFKSLVWYR